MELQIGQVIQGEVSGIKPYGAFVQLPTGEIGMVHISEIAPEFVRDITHYLTIGQAVIVKIISRNAEGKYNLSIKQVSKLEVQAARYETKVEEFRKALTEKAPPIQELQAEIAREMAPKREVRPTQESLLAWLHTAKKQLSELERHRQWRQRFYEAEWQENPSGARQGARREGS